MNNTLDWWDELSFLSPSARTNLGRLIEQLERGLTTTTSHGPPESPDGWAGVSQRGPWDRLVPSEWALAEACPEEFVRRADEGELAFWDLAREQGEAARSVWVWLDVGPDQLGACRVVQIALLLWLQKTCLASGGDFYWGVIQEPEKGYETLGAEELTAFLAARSLDPPREPAERLDTVQTWCVGSPQWVAQVPSGMVGVALQQAGLDSVTLFAQGRRLELQMPHHRRAIALLREPFVWQVSPKSRKLKAPYGRFTFNSSGQKIVVATDKQIILLPIPSSVNDQPGKPRFYELPWEGDVIAVSMEQRAINVVQELGDNWVFSRLNPADVEKKKQTVVLALESRRTLGSCWQDALTWHLWLEGTYYVVEGDRLRSVAETCGGCQLGSGSIMATSAGLLLRHQRVFHRIDDITPYYQVFLARSHSCGIGKLSYTLALNLGSKRWRLLYADKSVEFEVDGEVVGLFCEEIPNSEPTLVIRKAGWFTLHGPNRIEPLDLGRAVDHCQVHPNGLLAFHTEAGELCCYDLNARARLWLAQA